MNDTPWILVDTETTGSGAPIFVIDLSAQRMRGWVPEGSPFHRLLDRNVDIPSEVMQARGYTREIIERDGEPAELVYEAFADYVRELPLVSYHLQYDLDQVLLPEWKRLGIGRIGTRGFCALRLAQRLLDPVPAGNCKLRTLHQFYRLPQPDGQGALGNVESVVELLGRVLRPIAEHRGLNSWQSVCDFTTREWYPARIGFGKFKGRLFRDAETDGALRDWLERLSQSSNPRNAAVGAWYLARLADREPREVALRPSETAALRGLGTRDGHGDDSGAHEPGIVIYTDPAAEELKQLIDAARSRLAELEARYMNDCARAEFIEWRIYSLLRDRYRRRDHLERLVEYRRRYVETLLQEGEEEAEHVAGAHEEAQVELEADYESLDWDADRRTEPTAEQEQEIKTLWRKLVKMFHPDRHAGEPEKQERYNLLMQVINQARDGGDIDVLREIADDPEGYIGRRGWGRLDIDDDDDPDRLTRLYEGLRAQILSVLDSLNALHESPAFDMHRRIEAAPDVLDEIVEEQGAILDAEVDALLAEARQLGREIEELTGEPCRVLL